MRQFLIALFFAVCAWPVAALDRDAPFASIDGGELRISQWTGQPVMVVNTASLCGFADQFAELQTLYDRYCDQGLVVLAVPSDDFNQELGSNAEVKDYCELHYGIDLPMTEITPCWVETPTHSTNQCEKKPVSLRAGISTKSCWGAMARLSGRMMRASVRYRGR